jgi:hypothetical protein
MISFYLPFKSIGPGTRIGQYQTGSAAHIVSVNGKGGVGLSENSRAEQNSTCQVEQGAFHFIDIAPTAGTCGVVDHGKQLPSYIHSGEGTIV